MKTRLVKKLLAPRAELCGWKIYSPGLHGHLGPHHTLLNEFQQPPATAPSNTHTLRACTSVPILVEVEMKLKTCPRNSIYVPDNFGHLLKNTACLCILKNLWNCLSLHRFEQNNFNKLQNCNSSCFLLPFPNSVNSPCKFSSHPLQLPMCLLWYNTVVVPKMGSGGGSSRGFPSKW